MSWHLTLSWSGLLLGIFLAASSNSWFGVWCGLELNMLSFIACTFQISQKTLAETLLKYFLAQVTGSFVLLITTLFLQELGNLTILMATFSLALKMGAAPFHFWFPHIAEGLEWTPLTTLMTLQKFAPLTLLSYITTPPNTFVIVLISIFSGVVGALGGLNETSLRKLLSFSSINHLGWMLLALTFKVPLKWLFYLSIYSMLIACLTYFLLLHQIYRLPHSLPNKLSPQTQLSIAICFLSLAGLPPFAGFFPKWLIITSGMEVGAFVSISILIMSSSVTLFYYLRLNTNMLLLKLPSADASMTYWTSYSSICLGLNSAGLFVTLLLWSQELLQ